VESSGESGGGAIDSELKLGLLAVVDGIEAAGEDGLDGELELGLLAVVDDVESSGESGGGAIDSELKLGLLSVTDTAASFSSCSGSSSIRRKCAVSCCSA
jgi:hypothetical protein